MRCRHSTVVVSKLITDRDFVLGGIDFRLQIQNRAARRINFHYRDRSLRTSAENLSLQVQILSGIPINFPLQIQISGSERIDSVIISATTGTHGLLFRVLRGSPGGGGQQQFAAQTLRVHLLGLDLDLTVEDSQPHSPLSFRDFLSGSA